MLELLLSFLPHIGGPGGILPAVLAITILMNLNMIFLILLHILKMVKFSRINPIYVDEGFVDISIIRLKLHT